MPSAFSVREASERILSGISALEAERLPLHQTAGRVLAMFTLGLEKRALLQIDLSIDEGIDQLPFEFQFLGIGIPTAWTARDVVQVAAFSIRPPPMSGREITNLSLLQSLQTKFGVTAGFDVFNDVRWINDPDAPVSIPTSGAFGKRSQFAPPGQVDAPDNDPSPAAEEAETAWEAVGAPTHGSHAWVISPAKSASGTWKPATNC